MTPILGAPTSARFSSGSAPPAAAANLGFMPSSTVDGPLCEQDALRAGRRRDAGRRGAPPGTDWATAPRRSRGPRTSRSPMAWDPLRPPRLRPGDFHGGAQLFDAEGNPALVDDGYAHHGDDCLFVDWALGRDMANGALGLRWSGSNLPRQRTRRFANAQTVRLYDCPGSLADAAFASTIGDAFDWWAVPAPCGPGGLHRHARAGRPHRRHGRHRASRGGVATLMEFLAQEENLAEILWRTLFIPGPPRPCRKRAWTFRHRRSARGPLPLADLLGGCALDCPSPSRRRATPATGVMFNPFISRLGEAIVGELNPRRGLCPDGAGRRTADDRTGPLIPKTRARPMGRARIPAADGGGGFMKRHHRPRRPRRHARCSRRPPALDLEAIDKALFKALAAPGQASDDCPWLVHSCRT